MLLSKATHNKSHNKRETIQYIAFETVRTFIEPSSITIARLTHSLFTTKLARIRCYIMLSTI